MPGASLVHDLVYDADRRLGQDADGWYDDIKLVFESQSNFSTTSAVAKRLRDALDFLAVAFPKATPLLKNRTVVQSVISLACRLVATGNAAGLEKKFAGFVQQFMNQLSRQVELGPSASDYDFIRFQKSINANVKAGPRTRQEILLRKAFMSDSSLADAFDPSALVESGLTGRVKELGEAIASQVSRLSSAYAANHGKDLFKPTNKTVPALSNMGKPIQDLAGYKALISGLYFVFRESTGQRLGGTLPISFSDVNSLRTDLQHDTDHGDKAKIKAKKTQAGSVFKKYSGEASPDVLDPTRFVLVQANILSALELDLNNLALPKA